MFLGIAERSSERVLEEEQLMESPKLLPVIRRDRT